MRASEFAELSAFVAIAEERSFRRAATRLNLRPSTLSHTLRALEERLGVRLLNRTTRTVAPTEAGVALLEKVAPALQTIGLAVEGINAFRATPQGLVRLNVSGTAAAIVLAPVFGSFAEAFPAVTLEVAIDNGFVDIVRDGFDAGIRLGESLERDMTAVRVSRDLRAAVVASPAYWDRHGEPGTPRELREHLCIGRRYGVGRDLHRWAFAGEGSELLVAVEGPLILDSDELILGAAVDGVGVAMLEESTVAADIAAGRLRQVLQPWCPSIPGFFLYHPSERDASASLKALIQAIEIGPEAGA